MTQRDIKRIELAQDTARFLASGGKIQRHNSDDNKYVDFRKIGNPKGSNEVYS